MKAAALFVLVLCLIVAPYASAQDPTVPAGLFKNATIEATEKSLVMALESESPGLQTSAAATIRELKAMMPERSFSCFVIPLMRIVKLDDGDACSRVIAAIALHELHSAIGDYAIKRAAKFAECSKLKRICTWLAYYQLLEDHPELAPPADTNRILAVGGVSE
jgi:hypothetical protein